jgi:hypothetical protein
VKARQHLEVVLRRAALCGLAALVLGAGAARAAVVIAELHAAPNERFVRRDTNGQPRLGAGPAWFDAEFNDAAWTAGTAPFGFGLPGIATDLTGPMFGRTPSLYVRKRFNVTAETAARSEALRLKVSYNDGFVAFLNGREVARARLGPPGMFIYADATAFSVQTNTGVETFDLGPASGLLRAGENVLAVQVANHSIDAKGTLKLDAALEFSSGIFTTTEFSENFDNANGATRAHTNIAGVVQDSTNGAPPSGSWLANAANPLSDAAWTALAVTQSLETNGGTGHLRINFTGTGPTRPALVPGPAVNMATQWTAGAVGELELDQTLITMRHQSTPGFAVDLLMEPAAGDPAAALYLGTLPTAFGLPGPTADTIGWWRFDDAAAVAGGNITNAPSVVNSPALTATVGSGTPKWTADVPGARIQDPVSGTIYENRFAMDATAASSKFNVPNHALLDTTNGSFTVEFFLKVLSEPPGYEAFVRRGGGVGNAASSTVRRWQVDIDRSATRASFGRVRSRWDTPGVPPPDFNRVVLGERIYVDTATGSGNTNDYPADGAFADYGQFGDNTNDASTALWYHVAITCDGPNKRVTIFHNYNAGGSLVLNTNYLHPSAILEFGKLSASGYALALDEVRYSARVLSPGEMLRVVPPDTNGFYTFGAKLGSAPATNRAAFLAALNGAGAQGFRPVLRVRDETYATAPGRDLRLDDFTVIYNRQSSFVSTGDVFRYFAGRGEPSGGIWEPNLPPDLNNPYDQASVPPFPDLPGFADWVELHNDGATPVVLDGWSLTDSGDKDKWLFPSNTVIAAGGRLLVLCDENSKLTNQVHLHTNFKLSEGGERVRLYSNGVLQADVDYPRQENFHSYGLVEGTTNLVYYAVPTPGAPNTGTNFALRCKTPDFSVAGGFFTNAVSLTITSATLTAEIRCTLDGSEPTAASLLYTNPLTITASTNDRSGTVVRARAFQSGAVPSDTRTATFLINQNSALTNVPALCLSGDAAQNFFRSNGVMAIGGGMFITNTVWSATNIADYNMALMHGRPYERPIFLELHRADGGAGFSEDVGLRLAGSPHARPRYKLTQSEVSPWPANFTEKPSMNLFWREDYDKTELDYPFLGQDYPVKTFDQLRPRAGKNDLANPFIKDELVRRIFHDMGHAAALGVINTLYINGSYKGFYNTVERYRNSFFQAHFDSSADWDIRINDGLEEGDTVEWTNMLATLNRDLNVRTNFDNAMSKVAVDEMTDYFLLNIYVSMWDWPQNNWVASRERTPQGVFRLHVWDAEGSFGQGTIKPPSFDSIGSDLRGLAGSLPTLFKYLYGDNTATNQALKIETRLRFADRVHKHFFNGGILDDRVPTNTVWARRIADLATNFAPLLQYTHGQTWSPAFWTNWTTFGTANWTVNGVANTPLPRRRTFLFGPVTYTPPGGSATNVDISFRRHGFWPATEPPAFSQHGGSFPPAALLSISTNGTAPAGSLVYYTLDGTDPREFGGAVGTNALIYTNAFQLPGPVQTTVKARVKNAANGEWSPLAEAVFILDASPPTAADLVVRQLHYNPADADALEKAAGFTDRDAFEFIEVLNISPRVLDLQDLNFTAGISYIDWTASPVKGLAPGETVLLVKNTAAFRQRYGTNWNSRIAGEYLGQFDNSGERVLLVRGEGLGQIVIKDFRYDDDAPWPNSADGNGASLLLRAPGTNPNHNLPESWEGTGGWNSAPGSLEWLVGWHAFRAQNFKTTNELNDPFISGLAADPDGDGLNNEQEFHADTDPLDSTNRLGLAVSLTPTNVALSFRAKAWRSYTLQFRDQLEAGAWQDWTNFPAASSNRWDGLTNSLPAPFTNRFFRLRLP